MILTASSQIYGLRDRDTRFGGLIYATPITQDARGDAPGVDKINAYVECINRLSSHSHDSRVRYFSWVNAKNGPTGKERIIYGTYTIYDTADCRNGVEKANALEPRDASLGAAFLTARTPSPLAPIAQLP